MAPSHPLPAIVMLVLALCAQSLQAETFALLIGVNRVDALPQRLWLKGPGNDVALMRQALRHRGVSDDRIIVLADSLADAAGPPTRHAIHESMLRIQSRVQTGDHVVLHLAGHGAQVPQRPGGDEPDGLDEVFLTADVGRWDSASGRLPLALYDHELGAWMDALADRGVTVLAVLDTCHAAGLSRNDAYSPRIRAVATAELGVPQKTRALLDPAPGAQPAHRRQDARVLAFAARAHESTNEEWLPRGGGLARARMYGVFSHTVAQALKEGVNSPQALLQALRARYAQDRRRSPVPQISGDGRIVLP